MACATSEIRYSSSYESVKDTLFREIEETKNVHSIIPKDLIRPYESGGSTLSLYATFGYQAVDYFHVLNKLKHYRKEIGLITERRKIACPNLVMAIVCIKDKIGECGELSTYTAGRIASIFDGCVAQVMLTQPKNPAINHAFCLLSKSKDDMMSFVTSLKEKMEKKSFEPLDLMDLKDGYLIDPLFRIALNCHDLAACTVFKSYCKENRLENIFALRIVEKTTGVFEKALEDAKTVREELGHLIIPEPIENLVLKRMHLERMLEVFSGKFPSITWRIPSGTFFLLGQGAKETIEELSVHLISKGVDGRYSPIKSTGEFALIIGVIDLSII